ncbi:MAG: hypothetical protein ABI417_10850 [Coleofasciculaceae cyanobacterium]
MLRQILIASGITVIAIGYSSTAYAQSSVPSSSNRSAVTLYGDSLREVERRAIVNDYQNFFDGTLPTTQTISVTNVGRLTTSPQRTFVGDQPVDVLVEDALNSDRPLTSFPSNGDAGNAEKVKLQLQLGNQ